MLTNSIVAFNNIYRFQITDKIPRINLSQIRTESPSKTFCPNVTNDNLLSSPIGNEHLWKECKNKLKKSQ